eukprot:COSAG01_NODE_71538_length_255_cov_1.326923_1_plen_76_part_01
MCFGAALVCCGIPKVGNFHTIHHVTYMYSCSGFRRVQSSCFIIDQLSRASGRGAHAARVGGGARGAERPGARCQLR